MKTIRQDIRAVIFDIDDTLFDRNTSQIKAAELIRQKFPHVFTGFAQKDVLAAFLESDEQSTNDFYSGQSTNGPREKRFRYFLSILGLKADYADAIADTYLDIYPTLNLPVPGAVSLVTKLSAHFILGIISNGLADVQYKKLSTIGLREAFSCIILSEEVGIRKPDPKIFHLAANTLKVRASECLYVGDSYFHDIIGAKEAGMKACWLNSRSAPLPDPEIKVEFIITRLEDLTKQI